MVFGLPLPSFSTLLSLPLLSFLALPSALSYFSWTTSLNIVFFYLAWATVVFSHDPFKIELFSTLAIRTLFYILPCLLFLLLDLTLPSISTTIKFHGQKGRLQSALSSIKSPQRLLHYVATCTGNVLLGVALQSGIEYTIIHFLGMRSALRISTALPMPFAIATDLTRAYIVRGTLTYYIHKNLLHECRRSKQLTRWHSTWQHSLATTMPFSASYDHPLVYLLHRWLPVYLPAIMFRMHMLTYLLFLSLISLEEAFAWSGYSALPSTVMLAGIARRTEAHLMENGRGNYGPWGVMDWVHGTTLGASDLMDDVQEEVGKRDVKGKVRKATNVAADVIDNTQVDEDEEANSNEGLVAAGKSKASRALRKKK